MPVCGPEPAEADWVSIADAVRLGGPIARLSRRTWERYAQLGLVRARRVGLKRWFLARADVVAVTEGRFPDRSNPTHA
jgi:hypothetical protein